MSFWGVAMTKSSGENLAKYHLERQDFRTYLPKFLNGIGKSAKIKALFPRYIFVRIETRWYSINGTRGVTRLIMNESKPAIVPDRIIDNLVKREDSKGLISLPSAPKFSPGEKVRVVNTAMLGYIGIYQGMRDHERARVLIELLGQAVSLELDEKDLAPVTVVSSLSVAS